MAGRHVVLAPETVDFDDNYLRTTEFIEKIRRLTLRKQLDIYINLLACKKMSPEAALVLAAEIQRSQDLYNKCINGYNPRDKRTYRLLRDLGFHELLNFKGQSAGVSGDGQIEYAHMISGNKGETERFPVIIDLVFGRCARLRGTHEMNNLTLGLNEAMLNTFHHAYENEEELDYPPSKNFRWWLAGYRDSKRKEVVFMFYDQGITIPKSLPRKWPEKLNAILKGAIGSSTDHELIRAAMEIGRTSSARAGRGWGLRDMRMLVGGNNHDVPVNRDLGSLRILSGKGSYLYNLISGEMCKELPAPFLGTLVVWRLVDSELVVWTDEHGTSDS